MKHSSIPVRQATLCAEGLPPNTRTALAHTAKQTKQEGSPGRSVSASCDRASTLKCEPATTLRTLQWVLATTLRVY